jgi:hypothetical protein
MTYYKPFIIDECGNLFGTTNPSLTAQEAEAYVKNQLAKSWSRRRVVLSDAQIERLMANTDESGRVSDPAVQDMLYETRLWDRTDDSPIDYSGTCPGHPASTN